MALKHGHQRKTSNIARVAQKIEKERPKPIIDVEVPAPIIQPVVRRSRRKKWQTE